MLIDPKTSYAEYQSSDWYFLRRGHHLALVPMCAFPTAVAQNAVAQNIAMSMLRRLEEEEEER